MLFNSDCFIFSNSPKLTNLQKHIGNWQLVIRSDKTCYIIIFIFECHNIKIGNQNDPFKMKRLYQNNDKTNEVNQIGPKNIGFIMLSSNITCFTI